MCFSITFQPHPYTYLHFILHYHPNISCFILVNKNESSCYMQVPVQVHSNGPKRMALFSLFSAEQKNSIILVLHELVLRDLSIVVGVDCIKRGSSMSCIHPQNLMVCNPLLEEDKSVFIHVHDLKQGRCRPSL